jgi:hypothetical protein
MAANTNPIYTLVPEVQWGANITAANTNMDGTGTVETVFTAGSEGSFVQTIRLKAAGTNVATVARFFINNGSTNTTAANNSLFDEISLPATTASAASALTTMEVPINKALPNGYKINMTLGTAVAAGWKGTAFGGDY